MYTDGIYAKEGECISMIRRILRGIIILEAILLLAITAEATGMGSIYVKTNGGTVGLYPVGDINGQNYRLYDTYGGGALEEGDILSSNLAAWLQEQAKTGQIRATDMTGEAVFPDLQPGLYLITQPSAPSGQKPFDPFLIAIPWDGYIWDVTLNLDQLPKTGDSGVPAIWMAVMLVSGMGTGMCVLQSRKKYKGRP